MRLSGVQRTLKFTKYMSKYNWEPTVLTTGKTAYFAHDLSLMKEVEDNNIKVVRTESFDINSLLSKMGTVKMQMKEVEKISEQLIQNIFNS